MIRSTPSDAVPNVTAAHAALDDPAATWQALQRAGNVLFESGDLPAATDAFARAVDAGTTDPTTTALLYELLVARNDAVAALTLTEAVLNRATPTLPRAERIDWLARRFDLLTSGMGTTETSVTAAIDLLEAVASAGDDAWSIVLEPARRLALDAALDDPTDRLDALELFADAPTATGLPGEAAASAEDLGHRHAADPEIARAAERLLHALGAPDAAYRVEASRRRASRPRPGPARLLVPRRPLANETVPPHLVVLIAGGHPPLRGRIRTQLQAVGVDDVREVPSACEAVRSERAVRAALAGTDLVVLIGAQIAHSTADQIKTAANALHVPVVVVQRASAASVRRAVLGHLGSRSA